MISPEYQQWASLFAVALLTAILVLKTDRLRPVVLLFGMAAFGLTFGAGSPSLTAASEKARAVIFRALP